MPSRCLFADSQCHADSSVLAYQRGSLGTHAGEKKVRRRRRVPRASQEQAGEATAPGGEQPAGAPDSTAPITAADGSPPADALAADSKVRRRRRTKEGSKKEGFAAPPEGEGVSADAPATTTADPLAVEPIVSEAASQKQTLPAVTAEPEASNAAGGGGDAAAATAPEGGDANPGDGRTTEVSADAADPSTQADPFAPSDGAAGSPPQASDQAPKPQHAAAAPEQDRDAPSAPTDQPGEDQASDAAPPLAPSGAVAIHPAPGQGPEPAATDADAHPDPLNTLEAAWERLRGNAPGSGDAAAAGEEGTQAAAGGAHATLTLEIPAEEGSGPIRQGTIASPVSEALAFRWRPTRRAVNSNPKS